MMKDADDATPAISQSKLFDLSIDLLCIADTDGRFRLVNPAFERTLGWSLEELLARPFYELVHPEDLAATQAEVAKLASGVPTTSFENRYRCADGSYKILRWNTRPDPTTGLLYAVAHDVTVQRQMERELIRAKEAAEAAVRARTEFLATVSHEIRTPMNGIIGMTELALQGVRDPAVRRHLEIVRGSADHLLELIEDLLDLSRIEAGRLDLDEEPFRVRETVDAAIQTLAWTAHGKGLEMAYHVAPDVPRIVAGDDARLRQVLVNLVGNAIKFTDRGAVTLEVAREADLGMAVRLSFVVTDTGMGILPERQAEIFERFAQLPGPDGRRRPGSGLGLPITRQLVQLMGGSLEVSSEPGRGSSFVVTVPFRTMPLDKVTAHAPRLPLSGRALVVSARAATRAFLCRYLEAWGFQVEGLERLEEADDRIAVATQSGQPVALCVFEAGPIGERVDLIEELERQHRLRLVAVVGPSETQEQLERLRAAGVTATVVEPVSEEELRAALAGRDSAASPGEPADRSLRLLVAEDGEVNRQVLRGLLESGGHRVDMVGDGTAAVAAVANGNYDVALLDLELPRLGGIDAARQIREAEAGSGRRLQLVALTGHASAAVRQRCLEAGMDDFLVKPITAGRLHEALARAVAAARVHLAVGGAGEGGQRLIDWSAALRVCGGQVTLLQRLVEAAREEVPRLLRECRAGVTERDGDRLRRGAHTLKSTLGYFGAHELQQQAEELELLSWRSDFAAWAALLEEMESPIGALVRELEAIPDWVGSGAAEEVRAS
jgi:two-component system, sensor histidine kinase and response regulator